jgi:hypothetical protein
MQNRETLYFPAVFDEFADPNPNRAGVTPDFRTSDPHWTWHVKGLFRSLLFRYQLSNWFSKQLSKVRQTQLPGKEIPINNYGSGLILFK